MPGLAAGTKEPAEHGGQLARVWGELSRECHADR